MATVVAATYHDIQTGHALLLMSVTHFACFCVRTDRCRLRLFSVIVDPRDDPRQVERDVRQYLEEVCVCAYRQYVSVYGVVCVYPGSLVVSMRNNAC